MQVKPLLVSLVLFSRSSSFLMPRYNSADSEISTDTKDSCKPPYFLMMVMSFQRCWSKRRREGEERERSVVGSYLSVVIQGCRTFESCGRGVK